MLSQKVLLGALALLSVAGAVQAATVYVYADGSGDFPTIQDAIDNVDYGDVVAVGPGTYTDLHPDNGGGVSIVELRSGVQVLSLEGPEVTVLDAYQESGERRAVAGYYVDGEARFSGFTVKNGDTYTGAGIYLLSSDAVIEGNWIVDNYSGQGGGIGLEGPGAPHIVGNLIDNNIACCAPGGAIYLAAGAAPLIERNRMTRNSGFTGGAIGCVDGGSVVIRNNLISDNIGLSGGAVGLVSTDALVERNWMLENHADEGGAVSTQGSNGAIFRNNVAARNVSAGNGGAYIFRASSPTLENETIVRNEAWAGAGIFCWYGASPTVEKCLIVFGVNGEGVYSDDPGSIPILSCLNAYGNDLGDYGGFVPDPTGDDGNVSMDPEFCGLEGGSYFLTPDSPMRSDDPCGLRGALDGRCPVASALGDRFVPSWSPPARSVPLPEPAISSVTEPGSGASSRAVLVAFPNPARGSVSITMNGSLMDGSLESGPVQLDVLDVHGRIVRRLGDSRLGTPGTPEGRTTVWDGTDDEGRAVPAGTYWVRSTDGRTSTGRVVILR